MLGGIISGIVVFVLCLVAVMILEREEGEKLLDTKRVSNAQWESSALAGIMMALICIFNTKAFFMTVICYGAIILFDIVLMKWWHKEGSDFFEVIPFILLSLISYNVLEGVAKTVAAGVGNEFVESVLKTVPELVLAISIGYFIVEIFVFRSKMEK